MPVPGLGNLLDVGLGKIGLGPEPHIRMKELSDQYGDVMSLQMGTGKLPWVVISSPEVVYEAFLKRGRDFSGRPTVPSMSVSSGKGQVNMQGCNGVFYILPFCCPGSNVAWLTFKVDGSMNGRGR